MTDNKADNKNDKPEEQAPKPRKKIEKPVDPLSRKPGQNYGTTKYEKEK